MPANTTTTALNPTQSPNNATWLTPTCQFWFVYLSTTHEPLMGTMFSKPTANLGVMETACTIARLTSYQNKPPAGHVQCFFKSGFRYFYQVNNQGQIVGNSMIQVSGNKKPAYMCSGNHSYREFINWQPAPQP